MGLWFRHLELEIGTGVLYYLYFTYKLTLKSGILGHHLDDILSFALKDFLLQDLVDFSKMTPITPGIPGVAAKRIKPLYEVYESDLELYAKLKNIRVVGANCPFKYRDPITTSARKMLDELEEYAPGFKISLSRNSRVMLVDMFRERALFYVNTVVCRLLVEYVVSAS